jgi:predicted transglutaminase-like cysteine proteinase
VEAIMTGRFRTSLIALSLLPVWAHASPILVNANEAPPIDPSEPETVAGTPELLELIDAVNRYVNRTILPVKDIDARGVIDRWEYPVNMMGDCEDFQLLKRRYLVAAGVPHRALPMTVVLDERGDGHAVLTVRTETEDLILDNNSNEVLRWDKTGYAFIKREASTPTGWAFVEAPVQRPVVTAAAR